MTCMLEIKDKSDTWWKLLKITLCYLQKTNNRSLLPRDDFSFLGKAAMHFSERLRSFGKDRETHWLMHWATVEGELLLNFWAK